MGLKTLFRKAEKPNTDTYFRDLYTRVLLRTGLEGTTVLGVTSAMNGEGKTTIARQFARLLAADGILAEQGGRAGSVLLVECNQRPAGAGAGFAAPEAPGLTHYLQRECTLEEAVKPTDCARLWTIPAGAAAGNFSILIRTTTMDELMRRLRARFDFIVLDLPAVLATTDTQMLAELTDYLVLVVRAGSSPSKLVRQALDGLDGEKLLGVVLNDSRPDLPDWLEHRL